MKKLNKKPLPLAANAITNFKCKNKLRRTYVMQLKNVIRLTDCTVQLLTKAHEYYVYDTLTHCIPPHYLGDNTNNQFQLCSHDIRWWIMDNNLEPNTAKSEILLCGNR